MKTISVIVDGVNIRDPNGWRSNKNTARTNAQNYARKHGKSAIAFPDGRYLEYWMEDSKLRQRTYRNAKFYMPRRAA